MAFGYAVYFSDRPGNRVIRWDPDSGSADVVAGESADGAEDQKLKDPYGLAFGPGGKLYIADKLHHRIVRLSHGKLEAFPLKDTTGHRNPLPTSRRAYRPMPVWSPAGLFAERKGTLLAAFYNDGTAYRIHPDGRLELLLGIAPCRPYHILDRPETVPPAQVGSTPLFEPSGVASRSDGTLFLIERGFQTLREYHPTRGYRSVFPFSRYGQSRGTARAPEQAKISEYAATYPAGLALDAKGTLYLAEIWHRCILEIDVAKGKVRRVMESRKTPGTGQGGICGLAFGPDGTAWVIDGAAGQIEAYEPQAKKPWKPLGVVLKTVRKEPLRFKVGGAGIVAGA